MDDANLETGAETATNDAALTGDDLTQRLSELIDSDNAVDESTDGEVTDQSTDDTPEADAEPIYTVKIDGKEVQVKQSELLAGYQRDSDYRNKTKAVSEQRQAVEAERQSVTQERNTALQVIERFQTELGQMQPQVDWNSLLESDPAEYLRQQHAFAQRQAQYNNAEQAKQYLQSQQAQEQQKHLQTYATAEQESLLKALPEMADEVKGKATKEAIKSYLKSHSYSDSEIGTVVDHRMVVIADKARRYDDLMAKASVTTKQVQKLPARVERPGNGEARNDQKADALKRLGKSGSIRDAANAFSQFI